MSKFERNKDLTQEVVSSTAEHVGEIARIVTGAVADITRQIGELVSDGIEMREAAKRAGEDERRADKLSAEFDELDNDESAVVQPEATESDADDAFAVDAETEDVEPGGADEPGGRP